MTAYCGCCGRQARARRSDPEPLWCKPCSQHVAATGHLWDRTFEAINGEPCPYQVSTYQMLVEEES
jgi:hypothetical protein